ncbi:uncharacterized protein LOC124121478 [Haliotis rufescens]|uniref:uncharacterized protein LOC124121478 n=1 Tax=Haliotis rufescens TaxID=6454 RepID=UPI00201F291C|nr:uncharacterized protein LOC124121478 [Haliotis rufescens]
MTGVVESLKAAPLLKRIIFILVLVTQFFNWLSFTTPAWARRFTTLSGNGDDHIGYGLWRSCSNVGTAVNPIPNCFPLDGANLAHYGTVQAFATIGFMGVNILFLVTVLQMFTSFCKKVTDINEVNAVQAIVTGIIYFIGLIIYGAVYGSGERLTYTIGNQSRKGDLSYSYVFAFFTMILQIVLGVLLLLTGGKLCKVPALLIKEDEKPKKKSKKRKGNSTAPSSTQPETKGEGSPA